MPRSLKAPKAPSQRGRPYREMSLLEFERAFPDECACYDFLGVGPKHVDRYLAELIYRYNRRRCHGELFEGLLYACLTADPAPQSTVSR